MSNIRYRDLEFAIAFKEFHPPLPVSLWAADPFLKTYQKITGTDVGFIYEVVNSQLVGYMQANSDEIIWQSIKDRLSVNWIMNELQNFEQRVVKLKETIDAVRTKECARAELASLFRSIYEKLGEIYPYSNAFYMLSPKVEGQIIEKLKNIYPPEKAGQILAALSKPVKPTSLVQFSRDTEEISRSIEEKYGMVVDVAKISEIYGQDEEIKAKVDNLQRKYFCLSGINAGIRTVQSFFGDILPRQKPVEVETAEVPKQIKDELAILQVMIYFKDEISTFIIPYVQYGLEAQWARAAQILGLSLENLNQLIFTDLIDCLEGETTKIDNFDERRKGTFFFHAPFRPTEVLYGDDAVREIEAINGQEQQEDYSSVTEVKGKTGSVGKITGKVQIIHNSAEMVSFQEGNILVAVYTAPEYVPVMKKSAAVVTDTGGITCHAAIVSRELGIPCVVGTKIATRALKDGMEVEVDADNGVVKILNHV